MGFVIKKYFSDDRQYIYLFWPFVIDMAPAQYQDQDQDINKTYYHTWTASFGKISIMNFLSSYETWSNVSIKLYHYVITSICEHHHYTWCLLLMCVSPTESTNVSRFNSVASVCGDHVTRAGRDPGVERGTIAESGDGGSNNCAAVCGGCLLRSSDQSRQRCDMVRTWR